MSSGLYRNFLRLLEKWPIDTTKKGRDLGEHIRQQVALNFNQGELSRVDEKLWQSNYEALNKIASNHYKERFPLQKVGTASGLTPEQCREIVSTEFLQLLREGKY